MRGTFPFVETLACECRAAKAAMAARSPGYVRQFTAEERRDPKLTTMVYMRMDREHDILSAITKVLTDGGFRLVAPILDGGIFCPAAQDNTSEDHMTRLLDKIKVSTEHECCVKPWASLSVKRLKREHHSI